MATELKIRFIRNFILEPVATWLSRELIGDGLSLHCEFGGYASAMDEIAKLADHDDAITDLTVLAMGLEMTSPEFGHMSWAAEAACERHLLIVRAAIRNCRGPLLINTVLPPLFSPTGGALLPGCKSSEAVIEELNLALRGLVIEHPGRVALADWTAYARQLGEVGTYDQRFWRTSGAPFAMPFMVRYARDIAAVVRINAGRIRKCLVLDCDNTLWGGVIGEDGLDGIMLADDSLPGAYFQQFHRSILDLHERGVAIALCSKNNEADVFDVLDKHPNCLIRREHLSAWRIDWHDKPRSIVAIAAELNIGLDALVFADDSPQECELVAMALPEVKVLRVPQSPIELVGFLERQNPFEALVVTSADRGRTRDYRKNRERNQSSAAIGDLGQYKKSLGTKLKLRDAGMADVARVVQLLQRTNQFNLTTRRHNLETVQAMLSDPDALLLCAQLEDRFGDLGVIGLAIVLRHGDEACVDTLLMSCRALGRDAELAFAAGLYRMVYARWRPARLVAEFIATEKNAQVADYWERVGLVCRPPVASDGRVQFQSTRGLPELSVQNLPMHVTLLVPEK